MWATSDSVLNYNYQIEFWEKLQKHMQMNSNSLFLASIIKINVIYRRIDNLIKFNCFLLSKLKITLVKVSDWNSFLANQKQSDSFRYLYPSQCESIWLKPWVGSITLGLIRIHSEWFGLNRIDFLSFFSKREKIRFSDWFGMIRIDSDI